MRNQPAQAAILTFVGDQNTVTKFFNSQPGHIVSTTNVPPLIIIQYYAPSQPEPQPVEQQPELLVEEADCLCADEEMS